MVKKDFAKGLVLLAGFGFVFLLFGSLVFSEFLGSISTALFFLLMLGVLLIVFFLILKRSELNREAWISLILAGVIIVVVLYFFRGIIPREVLGSIKEPMNFLQSIIRTG